MLSHEGILALQRGEDVNNCQAVVLINSLDLYSESVVPMNRRVSKSSRSAYITNDSSVDTEETERGSHYVLQVGSERQKVHYADVVSILKTRDE